MSISRQLKKLRKEKGFTLKELSIKSSVSISFISDIENGRRKPSIEKLKDLSEALGLPIESFFDESDDNVEKCKDCGLKYCPNIIEDYNEHRNYHKKWKVAIKKFGSYYKYDEREIIKKNARSTWEEESSTNDEKYVAAIEFFRAYFSRSLETSDFNLNHVSFDCFISMLLNNDFAKEDIPSDIYSMLLSKFEKKEGIKKGSSYYTISDKSNNNFDNLDTIAAHFEGKKITPKKMKLIEQYIDALFDNED